MTEEITERIETGEYDDCLKDYLMVPLQPEKYPHCIELFSDISRLKPQEQGKIYDEMSRKIEAERPTKCVNPVTFITQQNVGLIPEEELVLYSEPEREDIIYCFTLFELREMFRYGDYTNPTTRKPFSQEFIDFINNDPRQPTGPVRTLIDVVDELEIPVPRDPVLMAQKEKIQEIEETYDDPYVTVEQYLELNPQFRDILPEDMREDREKIIDYLWEKKDYIVAGLYSLSYVIMKIGMLKDELNNPLLEPTRADLEAQIQAFKRGYDAIMEPSSFNPETWYELIEQGNVEDLRNYAREVRLTVDNVRSDNNQTLDMVVEYGNLPILRFLIEEVGLTIDDIRIENNYALGMASQHGHTDIVKFLINEVGLTADDARDNYNYALGVAAANGHLDIVKFLINEVGLTADDARGTNNRTLIDAARNGHLDVIQFLIKEGGLTANDILDKNNSALKDASRWGHTDVVKFLIINCGLTMEDIRDKENYVLRIAAQYGHLDIVKFLIKEVGLTADDIRSKNNYALKNASKNGHLNVVQFLVEEGDLTANDIRSNNNYAIRMALRKDHQDVADYLQYKIDE